MATLKEVIKDQLYGGYVTVTETKVATYSTIAVFLPMSFKFTAGKDAKGKDREKSYSISEPLMVVGFEDKFAMQQDQNGNDDLPTGYLLYSPAANDDGSFNKSKAHRLINDLNRYENNGVDAKVVSKYNKMQKLLSTYVAILSEESVKYLQALEEVIFLKAAGDMDYFKNTPPEDAIAELWPNADINTSKAIDAASKLYTALKDMGLAATPDDEKSLQERTREVAGKAVKAVGAWTAKQLKKFGAWTAKGIKAGAKKQLGRIGSTLKGAFGAPKQTTFGGVDVSSMEAEINGNKVKLTDTYINTYNLGRSVKYEAITDALTELNKNGYIAWLTYSGENINLNVASGELLSKVTKITDSISDDFVYIKDKGVIEVKKDKA
jgi:hypothetical protein